MSEPGTVREISASSIEPPRRTAVDTVLTIKRGKPGLIVKTVSTVPGSDKVGAVVLLHRYHVILISAEILYAVYLIFLPARSCYER